MVSHRVRFAVYCLLALALPFALFWGLDPLFRHWQPPYRPFMLGAILVIALISVARSNWSYFRGRRRSFPS